jgi:hypothetical protein
MIAQQIVRTYYVPDWNAIGAIATAAAVIVAVGWEPIRRWWNSPKLKVTWRIRDSEILRTDDFGATAMNVRLFVENTGRSAAQRVELTLADVYRRLPDSSLQLVAGFLPTALIWTHTSAGRWEYLAPKSSRLCNLGSLHEAPRLGPPINRSPHLYFDLDTEVRPVSKFNILPPGAYVISIIATAINCVKADKFEVGVNIGPHVVNGDRVSFSFFDVNQLDSVRPLKSE